MTEKIRLSNDTVVDPDTIPTEQLIALIESGEAKIAKIEEDNASFFASLTKRHQQASAECGDF